MANRLAIHLHHRHLQSITTQSDGVAIHIAQLGVQAACREQGRQFGQEFVAQRALFSRPHHHHWRRTYVHCGTTCRAMASTVREGTSPTAVT